MKEWKDRNTAIWRIHPHDIFAMYKFAEYIIDDAGGSYRASIHAWGHIMVADERKTKRFMNYIKDNISEVDVIQEHIKEGDNIVPYYTVIIDGILKENDKRTSSRERQTKFRSTASLTYIRRAENLEKIMNQYHPKKRELQLPTARGNFSKIMIEASKDARGIDKAALEDDRTNTILKYIERLKQTEEWERDGGKYLLGFGNFIKAREWEKPFTKKEIVYNSDQTDDINDLLENSHG